MMLNYSLIQLPYHRNLIAHYAALVDFPGFVLLESGDKIRGRYDILSACPYARFCCTGYEHVNDYLRQLQHALPLYQLPLDLPFQGGLIGYFTYDLGASLMGVAVPGYTALGPADACLADFGLYDWAIITDHHKQTVTLFAAHYHADTKAVVEEVLARWERKPHRDTVSTVLTTFEPLISEAAYYESFHAIWQALNQGRCYQVNYTQPFNADYQGNTWSIFKKIRADNPVPFSAYLRGEHQDIISFSPERLLMHAESRLLTSPIKGTVRRASDETMDKLLQHELLNSAKNRAENTMIVDLLRNDLSKIAESGSVQVTALCQLETYRSVHHLVSTIEAVCRGDKKPLDAFLSCFPGGSITGAPKLEAMRVIYEQEPYARGAYCGSVAYFSAHGRFDSSIAIRTLIARENQLSLSAGGGIVIDSRCDEEYAECLVKIKSLRDQLKVSS